MKISPNKIAITVILGVIIVSVLSLFMLGTEKKGTAEISIDGKIIKTIVLENEPDGIISLKEYGVLIELKIKDHQIRFFTSDCPNKTCIKSGYISHNGEIAVCLPNKTAISIR